MNRCPNCQTENPVTAAFCMRCGRPFTASQTAGAGQIPVPPRSKAPLWIGLGALVLVLAGLGIGMSGLLQRNAEAPPRDLLSRSADAQPPPLLQVERDANPNIVTRDQRGMPADVRAWLQHLERIERQRKDVSIKQIGAFTVSMTSMQMAGAMDALKDLWETGMDEAPPESKPPTSSEQFHNDVVAARATWRKLLDDFAALPPPSECIPLRNEYSIALQETSGMMMDLLTSLDEALSSDDINKKQDIVGKLYGMKGASAVIDQAGGKSDALLGELCSKYETPKWFSIASDIGSGGMMRAPGF